MDDHMLEFFLNPIQIHEDFDLSLDFQIVDNKPIRYSIAVLFDGEDAANATVYASASDGMQFALCTTIYYSFRPSVAFLTVEPAKTDVVAASENVTVTETAEGITATIQPPKTPEQMQQEAENSGWLSIWHEFSWWYPWYRLHINVTLGGLSFDVGFSQILPFGTTFSMSGFNTLAPVLSYITEEIWQNIAIDFIGLFASYIAAKVLSLAGEVPGLIAIGLKGLFQWGLFIPLFLSETAGSAKMLAAFIANMLMGFIALSVSIAESFVKALWNICTAPWVSACMYMANGAIAVAAPLELIRTRVDYIESCVIDFPMAIFAFARFMGWI